MCSVDTSSPFVECYHVI